MTLVSREDIGVLDGPVPKSHGEQHGLGETEPSGARQRQRQSRDPQQQPLWEPEQEKARDGRRGREAGTRASVGNECFAMHKRI